MAALPKHQAIFADVISVLSFSSIGWFLLSSFMKFKHGLTLPDQLTF